MKEKISVGIVGATGYTGGELIRILLHHPDVELKMLHSRSSSGRSITDFHQDLYAANLFFSDSLDLSCEVLFLCMGHGASGTFLQDHEISPDTIIIDLSNEFRLVGDHGYIYGLPELQRSSIAQSKRIANPGCFATAIQLGLLPFYAGENEGPKEVHVHAMTGSTGAGKTLRETTHFTWRNNNVSIYKAFGHQHVPEIKRSLTQLSGVHPPSVHFVPIRGNFPRGILASTYFESNLSELEAQGLFDDYYGDHPFVHRIEDGPNIKQVVNTNHAVVQVKKYEQHIHVISAIDNLVKGASGQAVQNMNLALGLPESTGLQLKSIGL